MRLLRQPPPDEKRTPAQLREHYEVERELAARLRRTSADERVGLYSVLYDELYRRVPFHPRNTRKTDPLLAKGHLDEAMALLGHFLKPDSVYLEIGPGDCGLTLHVSSQVKQAYAVDVSKEASKHIQLPSNMKLVISDGKSIDVPPNTITVAYSTQLMEHIHPDDALEHLRNIVRSLASGGVYICTTPNRLTGPHDISVYFDEVATGMHMREYTASELVALFRGVGFSGVRTYIGIKGKYFRFPLGVIVGAEKCVSVLPHLIRAHVVTLPVIRRLLCVSVVGIK
ncbi:SAM-dependent methyltransferase [Bradyrhizobium japonicum]|nr:methyltransferase domain-containing protein [Bradyrhizobium diazoefficiens]MBP1063418.1 SAM-dependent methyltransferase [Bradyrhizobium japonicum]BCA06174.1 hypothetical protein H12S4_70780 [Bradyrhizobium diazoefficiens]BCF02644.1 hypothetical protein XF11B_66640 [Bradyrhizobium diazoefficiens]BCF08538.1 hypothetical protein XF12B_39110 [Bradyrhizobium diazoefficiens]